MFIYRTELFEQQVQEQSNLSGQINRLCQELAAMSVEQAQSRFEHIYPFLKRKESNLRLVARIYQVDKIPILCLLTLFCRSDRAYQEFLRYRENYAHQSWAPEVEPTRLREWLQRQIEFPEVVRCLDELRIQSSRFAPVFRCWSVNICPFSYPR